MALPAHQTKHLPILQYPFLDKTFTLTQSNDGRANGTALWLGAQCLSAFLADVLLEVKEQDIAITSESGSALRRRRPRAIELGSGIGLSAYVYRPFCLLTIATFFL